MPFHARPQVSDLGLCAEIYVSEGGLEPPRPCGHQPLKLARLPIPPLRRGPPGRPWGEVTVHGVIRGIQPPEDQPARVTFDQSTVPSTAVCSPWTRSATTTWVRNWAMGTTTNASRTVF